MIVPSAHTLVDFVVILVALAGFSVATFIHHKKQTKKPLVCPLRSNCDTVIHSDYSHVLGIPIELLGMGYYAFIASYHLWFIISPSSITQLAVLVLLLVSTIAFLFSIYLTAIQAFVLKEWCMWCLTSATFCLSIFLLTLLGSPILSGLLHN